MKFKVGALLTLIVVLIALAACAPDPAKLKANSCQVGDTFALPNTPYPVTARIESLQAAGLGWNNATVSLTVHLPQGSKLLNIERHQTLYGDTGKSDLPFNVVFELDGKMTSWPFPRVDYDSVSKVVSSVYIPCRIAEFGEISAVADGQ